MTEQQNKPEVISAEKLAELRDRHLGSDLIQFLTSPTPDEYVDERVIGGGKKAKYIFGHYFIRKLNEAFGFLWSYNVPEHFSVDNHIVVKGEITIHIPGREVREKNTWPDGRIVETITKWDPVDIKKTQFGGSEIKRYSQDIKNVKSGEITYKKGDMIDLANDYKGASTDALKKCGTELGIGLDIYGKAQEKEGVVTKEQLETLYMRAERAGMDKKQAAEWAKTKNVDIEHCDPMDVMGLIPELIKIAKEKKV